jgi:hypothetical protein
LPTISQLKKKVERGERDSEKMAKKAGRKSRQTFDDFEPEDVWAERLNQQLEEVLL